MDCGVLPPLVARCKYLLILTSRHPRRHHYKLSTYIHTNLYSAKNRENESEALVYHTTTTRSTQPCIPPGSLDRVPAAAGVRAGMSPLPGGR